jgi:isopentenyl-diphosphate delta-isomerase
MNNTLHTDEEILDLVDEQDLVIGTSLRSEIYRERLNNFRVINAFLVNDNGELWIPRRTAHKKIFQLCLDMSVAGHVASGEEYDEAFRRELQEELNLSLDEVDWKLLGHLTPHEHGVAAFMQVYEIRSNLVPDYNKDDFVEFFWLKPHEILERIENGDGAKDDLPRLIKLIYS